MSILILITQGAIVLAKLSKSNNNNNKKKNRTNIKQKTYNHRKTNTQRYTEETESCALGQHTVTEETKVTSGLTCKGCKQTELTCHVQYLSVNSQSYEIL